MCKSHALEVDLEPCFAYDCGMWEQTDRLAAKLPSCQEVLPSDAEQPLLGTAPHVKGMHSGWQKAACQL